MLPPRIMATDYRMRWAAIALGALAAGLRLAQLGTAQFWYDESGTLLMSRLPLLEMVRATAGDTHPPLYFIVTWALAHLGLQSEFWLRLPSVVFSLISLYLVVRVAQRLNVPPLAVWLAAGFLAVSSFQLHYAQEARMYALLEMWVWWLLLAMLERRWFTFGVVATAMLYTHNYGLFYLAIIGLLAFGRELGRPTIWATDPMLSHWTGPHDQAQGGRVILATALPVVAWSPWIVALADQMRQVAGGYWIQPITPGGVLDALYGLSWSFYMPEQLIALSVMVTVGALAYAGWRAVQRRSAGRLTLLYLGFAPLALAVGMSLAWKPILLFRGLIGSTPALVLLVAWAVADLPRWKRLYAAVLIVPIMAAGLVGEYLYGPYQKGQIRQVVEMVRAQWLPGDVVYHAVDGSPVMWMTYGSDLPQAMAPRCARSIGSYSDESLQAIGITIKPLAEIPHRRAWIIYTEHPTMFECQRQDGLAVLASTGAQLYREIGSTQYVLEQIWLEDDSNGN